MTKTIAIDGKQVAFRASAAIPRLYRLRFGRDIMQDMQEIDQATKAGESIPISLLACFENMAYIMAWHADATQMPPTVEEWLESFETFSIYEVFPQIADMWALNMQTQAIAKKKHHRKKGR